jgi:tyrosinase
MNKSNDPKNLVVLFQRPKEPVSTPKYVNNKPIEIQIPEEYIDESRSGGLLTRSDISPPGTEIIPVELITNLPNLDFTKMIGRDGAFSLFLPNHVRIAGELIDLMMKPQTVGELMSLAAYVRDRVNSYLFQYALSVVVAHRDDTKDVDIPSYLETMPDQFVDPKVMPELKMRANLFEPDNGKPFVIPRQFTASDREEEHLLAYFREDIGVNLHHWHWHQVYPTSAGKQNRIVDKDRRGELFYYMHTQIISRYNVARICNGLARVAPLNNLRAPVPEGEQISKNSKLVLNTWL